MKQPEPVLVAPLFPELLSELLEVLSSLTLEEWENPTSCPGWTVQDIASHLLDVEVGQLSRYRDGFQRSVLPADGWQDLVASLNHKNARTDALQRRGVELLDYWVAQHTDTGNVHFHPIAGLHGLGGAGGAGEHQIAGMQRDLLADVAHDLGEGEQHIFSVGPLYLLAVETHDYFKVLGIDIRLDPRSHRREGVGALGPPETKVFALPGPLADVVAAGVAQDIPAGLCWGNPAAIFANDRHSFPLVVQIAVRVPGQDYGIFGSGQRVAALVPRFWMVGR
ncbi:MAG: maleylpyruvate isomerase N-terminal domain-containing protein [Chloroflexi bacterium]|nr:maleylpyruvate isomerase N-terminal domain-containing protein [Chloroflexota bacterium]